MATIPRLALPITCQCLRAACQITCFESCFVFRPVHAVCGTDGRVLRHLAITMTQIKRRRAARFHVQPCNTSKKLCMLRHRALPKSQLVLCSVAAGVSRSRVRVEVRVLRARLLKVIDVV